MVKRQRFTAEFKHEAVRLLDAGERPASQLAIDLGICRNQLYKWKTELAQVTEEREFFKKAATYFAKELP